MLRLPLTLLALISLQAAASASTIYPLWDGTPPNHQESELQEETVMSNIVRISKVQDPTIEVFLPAKRNANGQAVVICPGGGYGILAYDWEGVEIAKWLNSQGIAGVVLKYRLPEDASNVVPHLSPLMDAQRALRMVRHHAADWQIDPNKIGIMGFSAGGHLASTVGTHFDAGMSESVDPIERHSSRPDFMILMYPVVSFETAAVHRGSRRNLLGEQDSPALVAYYSAEKNVTAETPPTILFHSADDKSVPVQNSLDLYESLVAHDIPVEMHLYPTGGHGFGLALDKGHVAGWTDLCIDWLKSL